MKQLYSTEQCEKIKNRINLYKISFIFVAVIFVITETLLIVFANYLKKGIFMAIAALSAILLIFLFIYLIDRRKYYIIIYSEFASILDSTSELKTITITNSPNHYITLADSTCVYELQYKENNKEHNVYLSNIFENIFENEKTYNVLISCNYIVGYEDED